ncbi:MAG: hypothetical protein WBP33_04605 [Saprospiraceae bacterium]
MVLAGRIKNAWSVLHRGCKPRRAEGTSRDLKNGVERGLIEKFGDKKNNSVQKEIIIPLPAIKLTKMNYFHML